jgi:hypothetical protein
MDCQNGVYSACSCSAADPCGWQADGVCDQACADNFPADHFDDTLDCGGVDCTMDCQNGVYSACSCSALDPCAWQGDGICDQACADSFPANHFDDAVDCQATSCTMDCQDGVYSTCSCSMIDPCGWAGDGICDQACADNFPGDHFDDSADCGG